MLLCFIHWFVRMISLYIYIYIHTHKTLLPNSRCKPCTRRRMGSRCEYFPAKKRSAAEEEFSTSYRPRKELYCECKKEEPKGRQIQSWSVIAPKSGHRKTELRPFQTTLPWPSWTQRHYWKNEHVAAILSTLQIENDKLTQKLRKTTSLLNQKERAQVIEKGSSKQTTLLHFF